MFTYEAPQNIQPWQDRLDSLFPPETELSSLRIWWEAGQEWDEVGRFIIYQMLPPDRVPLIFLPWLEGPDPRDFIRYDRLKKEVVRKRGAPLISRQQWLLYRETGGSFGLPFWVVQGDKGGHKITLNRTEKMVARIKGHPTGEPPKICDLPYAPVDNRTIDKLIQLDMVRKYNLMVDYTMRNPSLITAAEERGALAAQDRLWDWLGDQVEPWVDRLDFITRRRG